MMTVLKEQRRCDGRQGARHSVPYILKEEDWSEQRTDAQSGKNPLIEKFFTMSFVHPSNNFLLGGLIYLASYCCL